MWVWVQLAEGILRVWLRHPCACKAVTGANDTAGWEQPRAVAQPMTRSHRLEALLDDLQLLLGRPMPPANRAGDQFDTSVVVRHKPVLEDSLKPSRLCRVSGRNGGQFSNRLAKQMFGCGLRSN